MKIKIIVFFMVFFLFSKNAEGQNRASHTEVIKIIRRNEITLEKEHSRMNLQQFEDIDRVSEADEDRSHHHLKWSIDRYGKRVTVSGNRILPRELEIRLKDHEDGSIIKNIPVNQKNQELVTFQPGSEGLVDLNYVMDQEKLPIQKQQAASIYYTITDI